MGVNYRYKDVSFTYLDRDHDQHHFGVFLQDSLRITDWFLVHAALRVDFHPLLDTPPVSPRVALIFKPTDRSAIRASFGTAFRTPSFLESYLDVGVNFPIPAFTGRTLGTEIFGDRLDAERILSAELGYETQDSEYITLSLNAYYNYATDLAPIPLIEGATTASDYTGAYGPAIDFFDPYVNSFVSGFTTYRNLPDEYHMIGGELEARVYPIEGMDIYANYALQQSIRTSEPDDEALRYRLDDRVSDHKFNFGIQYRAPFGLDVSVDLHVASAQQWRELALIRAGLGAEVQDFEVPAYYMLNARVAYRFLEDKLEIGVVGFNITNNRIRQHPFGQRLGARVLGTVALHL